MTEPYEQKPASSKLREKYEIKFGKLIRVPGTFSRENPSWLVADLFWAGMLYVVALVYEARELKKLRASFKIIVGGVEAVNDYASVTPDLIVKEMSTQRGTIQSHIDFANKRIHMLSRTVDPLPAFLSHPSKVTFILANLVLFYCIFRFSILHRHWRFAQIPITLAYSFYAGISWDADDSLIKPSIVALWMLAVLVSISTILHKALRERAWKPLTVAVELKPKNGLAREEDGEDAKALLSDEELYKEHLRN